MDKSFNFVIEADSDKFENKYIMRAECPCGGRYQIIEMEQISENRILYNQVKTMCRDCNQMDTFLFDITSRERKKRKPGKTHKLNEKTIAKSLDKKSPKISSNSRLFSKVARNIEEAYRPSEIASENDDKKQEIKPEVKKASPEESKLKENYSNLMYEFRQLKMRYSQATLKIKFLEEENKLMQILEEKLSKQEVESQKKHRTILKLKKDLEKKDDEIKRLQEVITVREQDIEAYKKMLTEKSMPGWRKLLGG